MEENIQGGAVKELTGVDMLVAIRKRLKVIICITLVAAILGGALGFALAYSESSYGAVISFNVSPYDGSDSLLYKLQSEWFAEKLLLDKNGLPPRDECTDKAACDKVVESIATLDELREKKIELNRKRSLLPYSLAIIEEEYARRVQAYNNAYSILNMYKSSPSDKVAEDESHKAMIETYQAKLIEAESRMHEYAENEYEPAMADKLQLEKDYIEISRQINDLKKDIADLTEEVVAPWRENQSVKDQIAIIMKSVVYEYEKLGSADVKSTASSEEPHKGYIKVTLKVEKDREYAEFLVGKIKANLAPFVINHVESYGGYAEVNCDLISTVGAVEYMGDGGFLKGIVTYAVILGLAAAALSCGAVIVRLAYTRLIPDSAKKEMTSPKKSKKDQE